MIEYELSESLEGRIHEEFSEARFFHGGFKPKGPKMYKSWFGGIKTPYKPVTYSQPKIGFGKNCGLGTGYVYDNFKAGNHELSMKLRADGPHKFYKIPHLNIDTHFHNGERKPILKNKIHLPFDWGYKKKKW